MIRVSPHTRRAPKPVRDDAVYDMLAKLAGADEQDLARELDRELSGISREELEQIMERR